MFWDTVSYRLRETLQLLMQSNEFSPFRLVGGTALSLQLGHRRSIDIDLFTDAPYGSINFDTIESFLNRNFSYIDSSSNILPVGLGRSYFIGSSLTDIVKLDVYYTDKFISPIVFEENIKMASVEEITAMKVEVVSHGGRKKDFWDLHELLNRFPISEMLNLHQLRYPWNHNREEILKKFLDFEFANDDLEPICLRNKQWDIIKLDFMDEIERFPG